MRDGEGATKFITRADRRRQGTRPSASRSATRSRHSPLVKTAFFASDPNLGRILAAIGYAGVDDLDVAALKLYLDDVLVAENGGRAASYREEDGQRVMRQSDITVRVALDRGAAAATLWTCDFSYDYVKINASYRSCNRMFTTPGAARQLVTFFCVAKESNQRLRSCGVGSHLQQYARC